MTIVNPKSSLQHSHISFGLFALILSLTGYVPAVAATFTVNSTADVVDESPGNGKCQDNPSVACTTAAPPNGV